jgi:hypothetical protein
MWSVLPKTQRPVVTLRYSPCDDTPTAAPVALATGGVSLVFATNLQKIFFFFPYSPLRYTAVAILHLSL